MSDATAAIPIGTFFNNHFEVTGSVIAIYFFTNSDGKSPVKMTARQSTQKPRPTGPITIEEVGKRYVRDDSSIIVDGRIYDITDFADSDPVWDSNLNNVGGDSFFSFHGPHHPPNAWDVLNDRFSEYLTE